MAQVVMCCVCEDAFSWPDRVPMLLPCLHEICANCVNDIVQLAQEKSVPCTCFVCSDMFDPAKIVSSLPCSSTIKYCQQCDQDVVATSRCTACSEDLCEDHVETHRRSKKTRGHRIDPNATLVPEPTCRQHQGKEFVAFCETCQILLCIECKIKQDRAHARHHLSLRQAFTKYNSSILHTQTRSLATTQTCIVDEVVVKLTALELALQTRMTSMLVDIDQKFQGFIKDTLAQHNNDNDIVLQVPLLQERCEALKTSARTQISACIKTTKLQRENLIVAKEHIQAVLKQTEAMLHASPIQFLSLYNIVSRRLRQLEATRVDTEPLVREDMVQFVFLCPPTLLSVPTHLLGVVGDHTTVGKFCVEFSCHLSPEHEIHVLAKTSTRRVIGLSPNLNSFQRKNLHQLASDLNLFSASFGYGSSRQLFIAKYPLLHRPTLEDLASSTSNQITTLP